MPSGQWRDSDRAERLPPGWYSRVRPLVFATYGDVCWLCGKPGADSVDHKKAGDDHSLKNLRPAHRYPCHAQKSAQEGVEARAARRAQLRHPEESHPGLL